MEQLCARRIVRQRPGRMRNDIGAGRREMHVAQVTTDELSQADEAFAGNRLLSTFTREARALIEPFGDDGRARARARSCCQRGDAGRGEPVPGRPDDDLDGRRAVRRPLGRGRLDRPRRRGRRNRQLRPCAGLLARRSAGRRAGVQGADGRARGCQEPLAVHRQSVLPLFRLSAVAGHAVGRRATPSIRFPSGRRAGCSTRRTAPATGSS